MYFETLVKIMRRALLPAALGAVLSCNALSAQAGEFAENDMQTTKGAYHFRTEGLLSESDLAVAEESVGKVLGVVPKTGFSVEARWYAPHMDAKVRSDKISYGGGSVGLKETLGFGNDNSPEIILKWKRMSFDYIRVHGTGERTFSGRDVLRFGGGRFHGQISAKSDFDYLKLNVVNPIATLESAGFDWSYGLTAIHWKGSVSGTEIDGMRGSAKSEDYWVPVPTLGLGAHAALDPSERFKMKAHISGLPLGTYGHFYDIEAGISFNPIENLSVTAGYRRIVVKVDHEDDHGKIKLNGPFAGLQYTF